MRAAGGTNVLADASLALIWGCHEESSESLGRLTGQDRSFRGAQRASRVPLALNGWWLRHGSRLLVCVPRQGRWRREAFRHALPGVPRWRGLLPVPPGLPRRAWRWRPEGPTILAVDLDLDLDLDVWVWRSRRLPVLSSGGAVPDLASPGFHDGGVSSGTAEPASPRGLVLAGGLNRPGVGGNVGARGV